MGRERRLRDRARNNAAGFHADFGNGDVNNVSYFINRFTFNLYGAVFLAANHFIAHSVSERCRNKGDSAVINQTNTHAATADIDNFRRETGVGPGFVFQEACV